MSATTYSFLDVQASLVGPGVALSLGAGAGIAEEGITVDAAEDINTMTIGADGAGMHSLHANKSGSIAIRTLKTSPINALLQAAYNIQTSSSALHGKNIFELTSFVTGDSVSAQQVAFKKNTGLTWAKDAGMNEWVFDAVQIDRVLGALT